MASRVQSNLKDITTLLSSPSPPDHPLNRHCHECEFLDHCRKIATEKDDLSLLSNLGEKERQKLRAKGIFNVTQLSYTFRPRRRAKSQSNKKEKYHHSLKALSIREKKIHAVGSLELKLEGTPIFLDIEGLPDRDTYYLIGLLIRSKQSAIQHSLWAKEAHDERTIWGNFLHILARAENPMLIHYGSYETTFLTRMRARYGIPQHLSSLAGVFDRAINLVLVLFAKVYYPTYSNGLKDIARYLGFAWSDPHASGLSSIVWRHQWEKTLADDLKQKLITYNAQDCVALERVTDSVCALIAAKASPSTARAHDFVDVDSLKREKVYPLGRNDFVLPALEHINKAAYWDYQRNHVFLRTDNRVKAAVRKSIKNHCRQVRINAIIELPNRPSCCSKCGNKKIEGHSWATRTIYDLKFSNSSIKRWVVKYRYHRYVCCSCHLTFYSSDRPWKWSKYGPNIRSYILYQLIELRIPQTTVDNSLNQLFGLNIPKSTAMRQKEVGGKIYSVTYETILKQIVSGSLIHADETRISIDLHNAYVWVLANHEAVAYVYSDSREGGMVQELLRDFKGVLISDFYSAYDSIDCPQQKCLIHLIRDLNEDVHKQPFNEELMVMVKDFTELLRVIIETVDRFGLKARFLRKHKKQVERFNRSISGQTYKTEVAIKYQKRFEKNVSKLFTFLDYDNVPWNNNNAEHAIKPFAMLRHVIGGSSTPKGIRDYLVLLSVEETCKYRGINFLDFLRSGQLDIDQFSAGSHSRVKVEGSPSTADTKS
jgi:Transposase IS66 family/RNase_H superfamily